MKYAWVVLVHHIDLAVVASMFIFSAGRFEDAQDEEFYEFIGHLYPRCSQVASKIWGCVG